MWANKDKINKHMDKLNNSRDATRFLRGLGLHLDESVVHQVVNVLSGDSSQSLYSLHAQRKDKPPPICAKASAYKIKKLYDTGQLKPYMDYLSNSLATSKTESEKAEHNVPTPNKEPVETNGQEKSDICLAPPDNIDVNVLKSWGVPLQKRAEILSQWLYWHKQGRHDICQIFPRLKEDITVRRFPFIEAERLWMADIWATKYHIEDFRADLNLYRTYRPQEHPKSYQVFIRDVQERCKPIYEARQKHLSDVENLLRELRDAVLIALATKKYDNLLKMEENPLFESLQTHCYDVYDFFWDLKRNLETAQYLESDTTTSEIDKTMDNSKRKELLKLQKDIITSIKQLRKAIDYTLNKKSFSREWCLDCYHDATIETNP